MRLVWVSTWQIAKGLAVRVPGNGWLGVVNERYGLFSSIQQGKLHLRHRRQFLDARRTAKPRFGVSACISRFAPSHIVDFVLLSQYEITLNYLCYVLLWVRAGFHRV